ncbi:alpha/beta fold hydrolase [Aquipuribacter hungaricus]|uniref:Alpha/beta fold hydrolase n=1 Tax=Aquipuribacter hungaricus TaxID=545624 RepID=A0ABV7WF86_9MICO
MSPPASPRPSWPARATAVVSGRAYRRDAAAAARRLAHPDVPLHDLDIAGTTVRWARYGQGPPVLVLHGSGGGWDQGVDWARRRLGPGHDVLAVSRAGYPGSGVPADPSTRGQSAVLAGLLDALGLDRVDVVALSAGSATALRFAGEHPERVRSLLLESPLLPTAGRAPLPPVALVRLLARAEPLVWAMTASPALVGLAAGARPRDLDPAARAELAAVNDTLLPLAPRARGLVLDAVQARELLAGDVPVDRVVAPTLVLNAAAAVLAPHADAAAFAARLPRGRLVEPEGGGHVLVGHVEELRALVAGHLSDPGDAGPSG